MHHQSFHRVVTRGAVLMAAVAVVACGGPKPYMYGDVGTIKPAITLPPNEKTPTHVDVTLASQQYVSMMYVVPGRGAVVVFPTDSTQSTVVQAGTHSVPTNFPKVPSRDSALARIRAKFPPGATQAQRDSIRNNRPLPDLSPGSSRYGYLLMFASPQPINYMDLKRRVEGITIPIDDEPAVNTVVKLVRGALPEGAEWTAVATEVTID